MNTASHDLSRHLGVLHDRLMDPTSFEQALFYFLEEFAGDVGFLQESHVDEAPHLRAVVGQVAGEVTGERVTLEQFGALYLPEFGFFHGQARSAGRVLLFFYFARSNVGLTALISGGTRLNCVARFELPPPISFNPKYN